MNLDVDGESFKCYLLDTGLLISLAFDVGIISDEELFHAFLRGRLSINEGMFFENAVAQQLRAQAISCTSTNSIKKKMTSISSK